LPLTFHREVYRAGEDVASNKYTAHLKSTVAEYGNSFRERYIKGKEPYKELFSPPEKT
jgi:hypothetical protein